MRLAKQEKHESSAQSTTTILHTFPTPQFRDIRTMWYDHANIHPDKFLEKFLDDGKYMSENLSEFIWSKLWCWQKLWK